MLAVGVIEGVNFLHALFVSCFIEFVLQQVHNMGLDFP